MEDIEIIEEKNNLLVISKDGVNIAFLLNPNGKIVEKSRQAFTSSTYLIPSSYAQVQEFVYKHWGIPYSPRPFNSSAVARRKRKVVKKRRQDLLVRGVQHKLC